MVSNFDPRDATMWEHLADLADAPLQQRWVYGAVCAAAGRDVRRVSLGAGSAAQLVCRRLAGLLPATFCLGGPILVPGTDHRSALLGIGRGAQRGLLVVAPPASRYDPLMRETGYTRCVTPVTSVRLDLGSPDEMRRAQHQKWRNRLCRAEASGLKPRFESGASARMPQVIAREMSQQQARGYKYLPSWFFEGLVALFSRDVILVSAWRKRTEVASMLFVRHGASATYLSGWASPEGRAVSAHALILFDAATRLADLGVTSLDLGTVNTDTAPGLARFKLGSGGRATVHGSTWIRWARAQAPFPR